MKKSNIKSKVKSARKQIETSLVAELTAVTGKLGKGSKKLIKKIEKGSKKLAKTVAKELEFAEAAVIKSAAPVVKTETKSMVPTPAKKTEVKPEAAKTTAKSAVAKAPAKPVTAKPAATAPVKK